MSSAYVYRKPVRRSRYSQFRRRLAFSLVILALFGAAGWYIYSGLRNQKTAQPISAVQNIQINGGLKTYTGPYFQFQDTADWVVDKQDTTATRFVYHAFRKNIQDHELIIYVNQVPIPLYLATSRVLPVRILNDNSLQATDVSPPCVSTYAKSAPHNVREVTIDNAVMLCDPGTPLYFVVLSEIGGDYQLNLKRPNGQPIQFVITYKDNGTGGDNSSIVRIASSFQTR